MPIQTPDSPSNKLRHKGLSSNFDLTTTRKPNVRVRGIALTREHGSWGMLFEPLVAAVAVAPSREAPWIVLLVVGGFLARQPLKILLANLFAGRDLPHNAVALKFTLLYGAVFLAGLAGSLLTVRLDYMIPFALVAPFAIYQVWNDVRGKGRSLITELSGSFAISSSAAVIAMNAGWSTAASVSLWGVLAARSITSIFYVRNRLLLEKKKDFSFLPVIAIHGAGAGLIAALTAYGLASGLTVAVFVILLFRASFGLSRYRTPSKAVKIGVWEVIYGLLTVISIIAGYYFEI